MEIIIKHTKRAVVTVFGFVLLILGIIMLVTPGPGWLFIILGLGVLATEYAWAHHLLHKAKLHYEKTKQKALAKLTSRKTPEQSNKKPNTNKPNSK